jgi:hypothetical protein
LPKAHSHLNRLQTPKLPNTKINHFVQKILKRNLASFPMNYRHFTKKCMWNSHSNEVCWEYDVAPRQPLTLPISSHDHDFVMADAENENSCPNKRHFSSAYRKTPWTGQKEAYKHSKYVKKNVIRDMII